MVWRTGDSGVSRLEFGMKAVGEVKLDVEDLAQLAFEAGQTPHAIAHYLSASEGWSDAAVLLGGAFSKVAATRLTGSKDQ